MSKTVVFVDTGLSSVTGGFNQSRIGREEIGALLVASCCQQLSNWKVRFLHPDSNNPKMIQRIIRQGSYNVLVFFPYTYTKWLADEVAKLFKDKVPIIYGGYHSGIGNIPVQVLGEGIADYVIAGRGENSLPKLLDELEKGRVPSQVIRDSSKSVSKFEYPLDSLPWTIRERELMQDLSREPLPFKPPPNI